MNLPVALVLLCLFAAPATCQVEDDPFPAFLDWFRARGGLAPKLTLSKFPNMGTGVQATEAVEENEDIIVVPMASVVYVWT